jgi:hypothetical protein
VVAGLKAADHEVRVLARRPGDESGIECGRKPPRWAAEDFVAAWTMQSTLSTASGT